MGFFNMKIKRFDIEDLIRLLERCKIANYSGWKLLLSYCQKACKMFYMFFKKMGTALQK